MLHPIVFAAVAFLATGPAATPAPLVQAVKTVCKSTLVDPEPGPAVCRGGGGRLSAPTVCFCPPGGGIKVDVPACWQDGRPAMHRPGHDFTLREYDSLIACSDHRPAGGR
jgi:hypothetical protein